VTAATSALAIAVERRNWSLAALCLLLGVTDVAATLPPETLERLLDLLEASNGGRRTR